MKNWQKWIVLGLRILFGVLLIWAAKDKLIKPIEFAQMVTNYRVPFFLTPDFCRWIGMWLPYVEVCVAVFLILGIWLDAAVIINAILFVVFTTLVTQAYFRGLDISCGCFAVETDAPTIGIGKIIENFILTALSIWLVWMTFKNNLTETLRVHIPLRLFNK